MFYTTSIVKTQVNKFVGWPLPIPLKCEQHRIGSVVNTVARGSVAKPYRSTLKYPYYKKNTNPNAHVRIFEAIVRANRKTSKEYIVNVFNYILKEMILNWCHNYMLEFLDCIIFKLIQTFCKGH